MADSGDQVRNGKAFEYALATQYVQYLRAHNVRTVLNEDAEYEHTQSCYLSRTPDKRLRFDEAARQTIGTMVNLEPGLLAQRSERDVLYVSLAADAEGQEGDVRDVVFRRIRPEWEIGFSAKNNHEAVKHSRLSHKADFGLAWLGVPCSQDYWDEVLPVFRMLQQYKAQQLNWEDIGDKAQVVYIPILNAFRRELLRINRENDNIPQRLIKYLIGQYPFYKIIKEDKFNTVVVKAFNLGGLLNQPVNGFRPQYVTPKLSYPTRIVEFEYKQHSDNTLNMILDEGWEISFRIHNASKRVESSLKFDINLIGNPPILFTQHLFQQ